MLPEIDDNQLFTTNGDSNLIQYAVMDPNYSDPFEKDKSQKKSL